MPIERVAGLTGNVGIKAPCFVATTEAILLYGEQTIDGVTVESGDRVLVKNQDDATQNGIYVASTGAWNRAPDFNGPRDAVPGTLVYIVDGDTAAQVMYRVVAASNIGTSDITWEAISPVSGDAAASDAAESADEALASALAAAASATAAAASATAAANSAILAANRAAGVGQAPVGSVVWYADDEPPADWLECDGSTQLRLDYPDLYAVLGTRYGAGDGSTNFVLPDLRGKFVRGWDNGAAIDTGRVLGSVQAESVGPHDHDATVSVTGSTNSAGGHSHTVSNVYDQVDGGGLGQAAVGAGASAIGKTSANATDTAGAHSHAISVSGSVTVANNDGTENRPRNIALMAIIRATGPSNVLGIAWANQTLSTLTQSAGGKAYATGDGSATLTTITQAFRGTVTGP